MQTFKQKFRSLSCKWAGGLLATLFGWPLLTFADPVDLRDWVPADIDQAGGSASNWTLLQTNDSVVQSVNGQPTVFYDPTVSAQSSKLLGRIVVNTPSDDDFIGFVLGITPDDLNSTASNFILVDWKQGTQSASGGFGTAQEGLAISHVTNTTIDLPFWGHESAATPGVRELARGATLGDTGWVDRQEYAFELEFRSDLIQVFVDGSLELSITPGQAGLAEFKNGSFGFYNYSQSNVEYQQITQEFLPPPEVTLTLTDVIGIEPDGQVLVPLRFSPAPGPQQTITISYNTSLGSASDTSDYIPLTGSLSISGDTTQQNINIPLLIDSVDEAPETFLLNFDSAMGLVLPRNSVTVTILDSEPDPRTTLAAAVLPASRSVRVGTTASAFASVINAGETDAVNCSPKLQSDVAAEFFFQATDPVTNAIAGAINAGVTIGPQQLQTFVLNIRPTAAFEAMPLTIAFSCADGNEAVSIEGLNTLVLGASATNTSDLIALTTTVDLEITQGTTALFAVASANVGQAADVTVSLDTGTNALPLTTLICATDAATGACNGPTGITASASAAPGANPTFAVFVDANGPISADPANNRLFIRIRDENERLVGSTSTAVRTQ